MKKLDFSDGDLFFTQGVESLVGKFSPRLGVIFSLSEPGSAEQ